MARGTDGLRPARKYDVPLFCGALAGDGHVLLGGGGGDRRHGIKNNLVVAKYSSEDGELSEEVYHLSTGDTPPFKLAVHPGGNTVVAAFDHGCRLYELQLKEEEKLVASTRTLKGLEKAAELRFLVFSPDGTRIAAGGEDKLLTVFDWPSMEEKLHVEDAHKKALKDADFSEDGTLLATTADSGPCHVWDVTSDKAIATLPAPQRGSLGLCRFARESRPFLFTTAVKSGTGWLVVWDTRTWTQLGARKFHEEPISALAVSGDGQLLATGTAEGEVAVINIAKMAFLQRVKRAHLVFVTAIEFTPDSKALLSASGDSSARVTIVTKSGATGRQASYILILLFIVSILLAVMFYYKSDSFWNFPLSQSQPPTAPPETVPT